MFHYLHSILGGCEISYTITQYGTAHLNIFHYTMIAVFACQLLSHCRRMWRNRS